MSPELGNEVEDHPSTHPDGREHENDEDQFEEGERLTEILLDLFHGRFL